MTVMLGVELNDGEERVAIVRADPVFYAPRFVFGMAWFLVPFFFFFPLLRLGWFGLILAGLLALSGALYLYALRASWYGSALVITSERCIDVERRGFLPPYVVSVAWPEVKGIRLVHRGFWKKLFGIGSVRLDLAGDNDFALEFAGLRHGGRMRDFLHEVQYLRNSKKRI